MLILSKILYGAESWIFTNQKSTKYFHVAIMNLYRRLARLPSDGHFTDEDILVHVMLPSPDELFRRTRLRYYVTLLKANLIDVWALLALDTAWREVLENDMIWMWEQLQRSSSLPDPRQGYAQWLFLAQTSPNYMKRLIRRACEHSMGQRRREHQVRVFHETILQRVEEVLPSFKQTVPEEVLPLHTAFGCMRCQIGCRSHAGEAAHMNKVHQQPSDLRLLFDQTSCGACLREYHTMQKLKAHLYYSTACRNQLISQNFQCQVMPGTGSCEDGNRALVHDRLLPPLPGQGPKNQQMRRRERPRICDQLHIFLVDQIAESIDIVTMENNLRDFIRSLAISWTMTTRTLHFFITTLTPEDAMFFEYDQTALEAMLDRVADASTWPFLHVAHCSERKARSIAELEEGCGVAQEIFGEQMFQVAPRAFGRHRIVLHAFSGRRRLGDLQFYLDQLTHAQDSFILHIVSMDVINDPINGDATNPQTCQFWIQAIRDRRVIAFVAGPPCESWSRARGIAMADQRHGPRIVRTRKHLWGLPCVRMRELWQLYFGNQLLCFALWAIFEMALVNGYAILEHPADPSDDEEAAAIWRLPIVDMILSLPNVDCIRLAQGLLGAASPKPTNLLVVNLPDLMCTLHSCRVRKELPAATSIGKDQWGRWRTTALKEYPPAFCR